MQSSNHEIPDEVTQLRAVVRAAMSTLADALGVMFRASGLPGEYRNDVELVEGTVLGLRTELDEARAEVARLQAERDEWRSQATDEYPDGSD